MPCAASSLLWGIMSTALVTILLSGLSLYFTHLFNTFHLKPSPLPGSQFGSCGNTSSSARLANCTFDAMSFSWLPPLCADPELMAEFLRVQNWSWWLDENATMPVSTEIVVEGNHEEVFVTREFHMYHCTYMWRKLHRGLLKSLENKERRGIVDTYIGNYRHTAHCEMMLVGMEGEHGVVDKSATDTASKCFL